MARLGVAVAGGVIGSFFGMPQLGFMAGGLVGAFLFPDKGSPDPQFNISSSIYGNGIPLLYGTARLNGMLLWADTPQKHKSGMFGKGMGGPSQPKFTVNFAMAFCEGTVGDVVQIYADGKLMVDKTGKGQITKNNLNWKFYNGSETQMADPTIKAWVKSTVPDAPTDCPAYRGTCYIMFPDFPISDFGNRIPSISAVLTNNPSQTVPGVVVEASAPAGWATVDPQRGHAYFNFSSGGVPKIQVFDLNQNIAIQTSTFADMTKFINGGTGDTFIGGTVSGPGSYLYVAGSNSNCVPIYKIDPDSLQAVGKIGTYSSSLFSGPNGFVWPTAMVYVPVTSVDLMGPLTMDYVVVCSLFGHWGVLNGTNMLFLVSDSSLGQPALYYPPSLNSNVTAVAGEQRNGESDFYLLNWYDVNSGIAISKKSVSGESVYDSSSSITIGVIDTPGSFLAPADILPGTSATSINGVSAIYDPSDDTLIINTTVASTGVVFKWSQSEGIIWRTYAGAIGPMVSTQIGSNNQMILFAGSSNFVMIDTRDGSTTFTGPSTDSGFGVSQRWAYWDQPTQSLFAQDASSLNLQKIYFNRTTGSSYPIASIIQDVCARCDMASELIDTSAMTAQVRGFVVTRASSGKDILAQLSQAFFFDVVESDYTLKFLPRGANPVVTITQDDLGSVTRPEDGQYWMHRRAQTQETPQYVGIKFKDVGNSYQDGMAFDKRTSSPVASVPGKQRFQVDVPVVATLDEARAMASTWLYTIWMERDSWDTKLGWQYLWLDPADGVTVNLDNGDGYTIRTTSIDVGADYSMKVSFIGEDQNTYSQSSTGLSETSPYAPSIPSTTYARMFFMNMPLLRDQDSTGGAGSTIYYAPGAFSASWAGGILYSSPDGVSYDQMDTFNSSATWGTALNALGNTTTPFSTDEINTLTVSIGFQNTPLSSVTMLTMLNGANAALLGQELIQFRDVTVNGDGTYTLGGLLRGCRGTEWATGTHSAGETFVLLETGTIGKDTISTARIGVSQSYKLAPFGTYLDAAAANNWTWKGYDLKPYAPVNLARATSIGNLLVTWTRRTRLGGSLIGGTGTVPLAEESELYDAYVLAAGFNLSTFDSSNPATYVRAFTGLTTPQFTYTSAQMTTDSFTPSTSTLHVVVFQRSAVVGQGFPGWANLAP